MQEEELVAAEFRRGIGKIGCYVPGVEGLYHNGSETTGGRASGLTMNCQLRPLITYLMLPKERQVPNIKFLTRPSRSDSLWRRPRLCAMSPMACRLRAVPAPAHDSILNGSKPVDQPRFVGKCSYQAFDPVAYLIQRQ